MLVDYDYYSGVYGGRKIPPEDWNCSEKEAEYLVKAMTFGRIDRLEVIPDCVKDAVCAASEVFFKRAKDSDREIKSENNDGYSVTYTDALSDRDCADNAKRHVRRYLANTGLLYKGRSPQYD